MITVSYCVFNMPRKRKNGGSTVPNSAEDTLYNVESINKYRTVEDEEQVEVKWESYKTRQWITVDALPSPLEGHLQQELNTAKSIWQTKQAQIAEKQAAKEAGAAKKKQRKEFAEARKRSAGSQPSAANKSAQSAMDSPINTSADVDPKPWRRVLADENDSDSVVDEATTAEIDAAPEAPATWGAAISTAAFPPANPNATVIPADVLTGDGSEQFTEQPAVYRSTSAPPSSGISGEPAFAAEPAAKPAATPERTASTDLRKKITGASPSAASATPTKLANSVGKKKAVASGPPPKNLLEIWKQMKKFDTTTAMSEGINMKNLQPIDVNITPGGECFVKLTKEQADGVLQRFGIRFEKRAPKDGVEQASLTKFTIRKKESRYSSNGYEMLYKKEDMVRDGINCMEQTLKDYDSSLQAKGMALAFPDVVPSLRAEITFNMASNGEAQVTGDTIFISITHSIFGHHGCSMLLNYDSHNHRPYKHTFILRKHPPMWFCTMASEEVKESVMELMEKLSLDNRLVVEFTMG
jgi:hypothetical protein